MSPGSAVIDSTGHYRYVLRREFPACASGLATVLWIMLNPSTADAEQDDPTIRRCTRFAERWGFDAMTVVNLFALRATDPRALRLGATPLEGVWTSPVGPENDDVILDHADRCSLIVAAWGNRGSLYARDEAVRHLLADRPLYHLGLTKMGQPRHPLYVPADTDPQRWLSGSPRTPPV